MNLDDSVTRDHSRQVTLLENLVANVYFSSVWYCWMLDEVAFILQCIQIWFYGWNRFVEVLQFASNWQFLCAEPKDSGKGEKTQELPVGISLPPEYQSCFELGLGQSMVSFQSSLLLYYFLKFCWWYVCVHILSTFCDLFFRFARIILMSIRAMGYVHLLEPKLRLVFCFLFSHLEFSSLKFFICFSKAAENLKVWPFISLY